MKRLTPAQRAKLRDQRKAVEQPVTCQVKPEPLDQCESVPDVPYTPGVSDDQGTRSVPIDEACKLLGCCPRTLWRAVDVGDLPEPFRIGRKSAWPMSTLLSYRATCGRRRRRHTVGRDRDDRGRYIPAQAA
jgi:predicted DNA-binding transcriptional regulator AlpA